MSYISARSLSRLSIGITGNVCTMSVKSPFRQWFPDPNNAGSNIEKLVSASSWAINGDGHASENFKMGLWGVTHAAAADDWDSDTMACLHLGVSTTGIVFPCIGRKWLNITPAASAIGSLSAAPTGASSQNNCFIPLALADDPAKGDYDACPLIPYGSFRMRKLQADATHWKVLTAITLGYDGWGLFNERTIWTFPDGINGSATGKFFADNGGTAPDGTWSTRAHVYSVGLNNLLRGSFNFDDGDPNGAGAVTAILSTPFALSSSETSGRGTCNGDVGIAGLGANTPMMGQISGSSISLFRADVVGDNVTNGDLDDNGDDVHGTYEMWI